MRFIQAAVTVLESNGVAQLTVAITMPTRADPIELSFFLLVSTLDGTATGLSWIKSLRIVFIYPSISGLNS